MLREGLMGVMGGCEAFFLFSFFLMVLDDIVGIISLVGYAFCIE